MGDNINRVKSGSVITIPTAEQAGATSAQEASQIIVAQSKDFNAFRRQLAGSVPHTPLVAADRKVSGSVQAKVEDKKSVTVAPDKLTLSKGALQGTPAEDKLAKERSAKEAASRAAEIAKNISDLSKLGAASSAVASVTAASAVAPTKSGLAAAPAPLVAPVPSASAPVLPLQAASSAASAPVTQAASAPQAAASTVAKRAAPVTVPQPQPEPSFIDGLLENPLVPAGAAGLIALLAGFGFYRFRQRKNNAALDSSFLDSRLQPDSFFGASGGQSIDTSDSASPGSSMVYSPSQLDAVDDVDPVAEADVYLAYGRDLQAEEILKDALRTNPGRVAIHQKLLEIFAKRRDTKSFEDLATLAFKVTGGTGSDWDRICELGLSIDPANDLYQPGGQPKNPDGSPSRPAPLEFISSLAGSAGSTATQPIEPQVSETSDLDLDLDLDFSLDDEPASAISETTASNAEPDLSALDLDFGLATEALAPFEAPQEMPQNEETSDEIEFTLPDLDLTDNTITPSPAVGDDFKLQAATSFGATSPAPLASPEPEEASKPKETSEPDLGMLEFDLGSLSLDLGDSLESAPPSLAAEPGVHEDPLATKLALAEEFSAIGDEDGARALIEEVIAEATGEMKIKAQRALSHL
ncbi:MAG: FimV/HubP family polar landmark protein [Pseudomonadota bacterium]